MLPILTLQNLMQYNNTLFDDLVLPDGANKQLLVDSILMHYGDMQPICPDWPALQYYIRSWFMSHQSQLQHLWNDYMAEYNPIFNKDGYIDEVRTPNLVHTETRSGSTSGSGTVNGGGSTSASSGNTRTETGNTTQQYQGFQSTSFQDVSKEIPNVTTGDSGSSSVTDSQSTLSTNKSQEDVLDQRTERGNERYRRHEYGNVGVTMASQMLRDDTAFWRGFSWYDMTAKLWAIDNLVMVY